ncbi:hypothetical protein EV682_103108 [Iodobacter fluviatilis]|uniref:Uncharacterized protein n=1 Tax=Iodobacter fluviatilis TaxID=537 RepID=A0A377Q9L3_9NEIS|nr:hypothetical protein EV682_103108 [Iodobacter fluviatilis]STQ91405.1 Uncharacterised protein [Iodobacter fluviatilis]
MQLKSCNLFQVIAHGSINHLLQPPNLVLNLAPLVGLIEL